MREHTEELSNELNDDVSCKENNKILKSEGNQSSYDYREDGYRGSHQESTDDYYRDPIMNVEDQIEASKLVLQLVTDSRFNMTQINGQRKLGGPPPGWKGPAPGPGCEVFVGKIPRTLYEHEIYPIFRRMGEVYEIRLMMDFSGTNRGYCFVMFGKAEYAQRAINELDNFEIRPGRRIGVVASINNCRLYVGQLPPDIISENVIKKIYDITDDVGQVAVYRNTYDQARYALISYRTHRGAAMARRRLVPDRASLFGGAEVSVDWAHPSMFPSNVVQDIGTCDELGNIEISRLVINGENKRVQNRRRVRDDFLDHSIRTYLQTDRALEDIIRDKQNSLLNRSMYSSLDSMKRGKGFDILDKSRTVSKGQSYLQRHNNHYKMNKNQGKIDILSKPRGCNSSFDLNVCSGSSESSGCSSQSSASDKHRNSSTEFTKSATALSNIYPEQIFHSLDNKEEFSSENDEIDCGIFVGPSINGDETSDAKNDSASLNLFDNYTFSGNYRDFENKGDEFSLLSSDKDLIEKNVCESKEKFLPKLSENSEIQRGHKGIRGNDRKFNQQRGYSKLVKYNDSKLPNYQNLDKFPTNIRAPFKNDNFKASALNSANFTRPQNRNAMSSLVWNKNSKNSSTARLAAENYLMQQQFCENGDDRFAGNENAYNYPQRNLSHNNSNLHKRAVYFSLQAVLKSYDNNSTINSVKNISSHNDPSIYSRSEFSGALMPQCTSSQVRNFHPGRNIATIAQNRSCQNIMKISNLENVPPINGRPILSRFHLSNGN